MSEADTPAVPAQAPSSAPTPTAAPTGTPRQTALEKGLAVLASKAADRPAPTSSATPSSPSPEAGAAPTAEGAVTPPPTPAETAPPPKPDDSELRLSRALRTAQEKERAAFEATRRAKDLEAKLKAAEELEAKRKGLSVLDVLKERGYSYEQLTREIVDGKLKPPSPEELATEAVGSEVAQLRKLVDDLRQEREASTKQAQAEATAATLARELKDNAKDFPVLATLPWAPRAIMNRSESEGKTYAEAARDLESAVRSDMQNIFASEETLKLLLSNDNFKTRILELLGIKQSTTASPASDKGENGERKVTPSAIPQTKATDAGTRLKQPKPLTTEERIKVGLAHLDGRKTG